MLLDVVFMWFHLYLISPVRLKISPQIYGDSFFYLLNHLAQILLGFKYLSLPKLQSIDRLISVLAYLLFSSVQLLSHVRLFANPWIAACQASLSITQLPECTETHIPRVSDATQSSHPLSSPSPPAPNASQHQSLFQWVNSSQEVAKVLEFQL